MGMSFYCFIARILIRLNSTLLKKDSFGNAAEIPWPMFANKLQRHFLRATRQDPIKPTRYLSRHELTYPRPKLTKIKINPWHFTDIFTKISLEVKPWFRRVLSICSGDGLERTCRSWDTNVTFAPCGSLVSSTDSFLDSKYVIQLTRSEARDSQLK